jgi:error-prone DNA polymerase
MPMTIPERMNADFRGTGLTIGKHPVAYHRSELNKLGALRAIDIAKIQDGHTWNCRLGDCSSTTWH